MNHKVRPDPIVSSDETNPLLRALAKGGMISALSLIKSKRSFYPDEQLLGRLLAEDYLKEAEQLLLLGPDVFSDPRTIQRLYESVSENPNPNTAEILLHRFGVEEAPPNKHHEITTIINEISWGLFGGYRPGYLRNSTIEHTKDNLSLRVGIGAAEMIDGKTVPLLVECLNLIFWEEKSEIYSSCNTTIWDKSPKTEMLVLATLRNTSAHSKLSNTFDIDRDLDSEWYPWNIWGELKFDFLTVDHYFRKLGEITHFDRQKEILGVTTVSTSMFNDDASLKFSVFDRMKEIISDIHQNYDRFSRL